MFLKSYYNCWMSNDHFHAKTKKNIIFNIKVFTWNPLIATPSNNVQLRWSWNFSDSPKFIFLSYFLIENAFRQPSPWFFSGWTLKEIGDGVKRVRKGYSKHPLMTSRYGLFKLLLNACKWCTVSRAKHGGSRFFRGTIFNENI